VKTRASGTFEVKMNALPTHEGEEGSLLGRRSLDKQYRGDLEATGKGEMLSAGTAVKGSAAYVAIERVHGTLHGKSGSFVIQHVGVMKRGAPELSITVVPDSGTDQLAGLAGTMTITIADGKHTFDLDYSIDETP
jgi:hypothetical protein